MYEGRLRSFSLHHTARTPVNGAQPRSHGNHMEPAINDGPINKTVCVLHSAKVLRSWKLGGPLNRKRPATLNRSVHPNASRNDRAIDDCNRPAVDLRWWEVFAHLSLC